MGNLCNKKTNEPNKIDMIKELIEINKSNIEILEDKIFELNHRLKLLENPENNKLDNNNTLEKITDNIFNILNKKITKYNNENV